MEARQKTGGVENGGGGRRRYREKAVGGRAESRPWTADGRRRSIHARRTHASSMLSVREKRDNNFHSLHFQQFPMGARHTYWPCDAITRLVLATGFENSADSQVRVLHARTPATPIVIIKCNDNDRKPATVFVHGNDPHFMLPNADARPHDKNMKRERAQTCSCANSKPQPTNPPYANFQVGCALVYP